MFDTHIDLGQVLFLAGGAVAWFGSVYTTKARVGEVDRRTAHFEERLDRRFTAFEVEVTGKFDSHQKVLFDMSGQLQRVVGALGERTRQHDPSDRRG